MWCLLTLGEALVFLLCKKIWLGALLLIVIFPRQERQLPVFFFCS